MPTTLLQTVAQRFRNQLQFTFFGKRDSSTSGQTNAINATPPCGQVTVPQGLHSKCSPTTLPMQIEYPSVVFICALTHARAGMYLALTVSVSLSLFVFRGCSCPLKSRRSLPRPLPNPKS
jgi:hypothetical protein